MSKVNGVIEKKETYLQHVSLKNYKSIKDAEIDFKPGLNIIIGKNGSGKTNFVTGLDAVLNHLYKKQINFEFRIMTFFEDEKLELNGKKKAHFKKESLKKGFIDFSADHETILKVNDKLIDIDINDSHVLEEFLYYFDPVLVKYKVPYTETTPFISLPSSFLLVSNGEIDNGFTEVISDDNVTRFVNYFFNGFWEDIIISYWGASEEHLMENDWKKEIRSFATRQLKHINEIIFSFSPIRSVRLNPDFNVIKQIEDQRQTVTNLYLEFLIDETWLPFGLLSDGTKRLFYIISEVLSGRIHNEPVVKSDLNIILLEEPELGIHPHQLHQLMEFIKEQSKEKQIILTTHSPQVLDALGPDELDRIIICHYEPKSGTQLSHLADNQIKKAQKYMASEAFLSDYWRFSDLEPA